MWCPFRALSEELSRLLYKMGQYFLYIHIVPTNMIIILAYLNENPSYIINLDWMNDAMRRE